MADQGGPRSSNVIGVGNVPRGQPYGTAENQSQALSAVPLSSGPRRPTPSAQQQVAGGVQPGQIPSLEDPSAMPDEPVTAGLPIGAGPGPEALGMSPQAPDELGVLRLLYDKYRSESIRRLIEWTEAQL